jgi:lipid A oxidase
VSELALGGTSVMTWAFSPAYGLEGDISRRPTAGDRLAALVAVAAAGIWALPHLSPAWTNALDAPAEERAERPAADSARPVLAPPGREYVFGAYGGVSYTHPSEVSIVNPGKTDMTMRDFGWIGRPFRSPIYYGLRAQRWVPGASFGTMLDFTHAKAIARFEDDASFSGVREGKALPPRAKVRDVFRHLEFSHGHNMLTLNGLFRMPVFWRGVRPYFGLGGGVSVPHTEVGLREEPVRTYEYQYAGVVGQLLAGLEVRLLGQTSVFLEYKFSYAPYDVPLSHVRYGWLAVTDLWRQLRAWIDRERPPGGHLRTTLATHHGIGGLLFRVTPAGAAR